MDKTIITLAGAPDVRIERITRDLGRSLSQAGVPAKLVDAPAAADERGDAVSLGQIALGLVSSGAVTALIECLKVYLFQEKSLTVKVSNADGSTFEVNGRNVGAVETNDALKEIVSKH